MNIFKKKQAEGNSYPAIVQEIHNEFECASDVLLAECEAALSQLKEAPLEKANLLASLGFTKTKEVVETKQFEAKKQISEQMIGYVQYYKRHYPNNKFITNDQVTAICEKYDLICGDVSRYTGFVPEVKLKQIANFKLRESEKNLYPIYDRNATLIGFVGESEVRADIVRYLENNEYTYVEYTSGEANVSGGSDKWGQFSRIQGKNTVSLQICAPLKDMDISGMTVKNRRLVREIPDPVVLQPVKGGYLILAMWADENFDPHKEPMLINETMN